MTQESRHCTPAASGFDVVSYHRGEQPLRGSGDHVAHYDGATYVFASEANKQAFEAEPWRYVPAFGGYCAYGISLGHRFVSDPCVWEIVEGRLYLNKDTKIQEIWRADRDQNIRKANEAWQRAASNV